MKELLKQGYIKYLAEEINKRNPETNCQATKEDVFDKMSYLAVPVETYGKKKNYLPIHYKKIYAFLVSDDNTIKYIVTKEGDALKVEALFYWNKTDEIPSGVGMVKMTPDMVSQNQFLSASGREANLEALCRGMAVSRAITDAGIGLQFNADIVDGEFDGEDNNNDSSAPHNSSGEPSSTTEAKSKKAAPKAEMPEIPAETPLGKVLKEMKPVPVTPAKVTAPEEKPEPKAETSEPKVEKPIEETPKAEEKLLATEKKTDEKATETMNTSDAFKLIADKGTYAGYSLLDIYNKTPNTIVWLYKNTGSKEVKEACAVIIKMDSVLSTKAVL